MPDFARVFEEKMEVANSERAHFAVYTMISSCLEKCVYPDLTPAIAFMGDEESFVQECESMSFRA